MRRQVIDAAAANGDAHRANRVGVNLASAKYRHGSLKIAAMEAAEADGEESMSARVWVCALAMMTTTTVGAKERLSMEVSPAMSFAPANLVIRTRLEPDADNRVMEVIAESEDFYRSSAIQLDGDRAPRTVRIEFRSLPPGEYRVTAAVIGSDGQRLAVARSQVNVMDTGGSR
jgi:methionine-rich copper-binding protein CopC